MKKKYLCFILIFIVIVVLFFVFNDKEEINYSNDTTDIIDMIINTDDGDEKIDWSNYQDKTYTLTKSITITESGVYNLTGTIKDGIITIDTEDNVKLVLDNVNITNNSGPAIYVKNASDVVIELINNNYLEDSSTYTGYEDGVIGCIFSHDDITFTGSGTLEIKSNNEDAIVSKDDLKIVNGTYIINSKDDGIRGKDSVYIKDGDFTINSGGDAIKTTNDTDTEKGYILIENGSFLINSELDGIDAQTKLSIQNGNFNITTGGGSNISSTNDKWGYWGNTNTDSAKGIKAGDNLLIENAVFELNTSDDAIHCNNYVGIKNASINITSGDDGIHADTELIIDSGSINILKSYEGLEASKITINNGNIDVNASDDGINVAGGNDSSSMGRPGENNFSENTDNILTINNGIIYVNATGDGIDVNGSAYINGGNIKVDGPENGGNGTIDYDRVFAINGGTFIGGGSNGMLQSLSASSSVYNVTISFASYYDSSDVITILDEDGKEIINYSSSKKYSSLIIGTQEFKKNKTYKININDTLYDEFTIKNITTTIGNVNEGMNGQPGGHMGGRR